MHLWAVEGTWVTHCRITKVGQRLSLDDRRALTEKGVLNRFAIIPKGRVGLRLWEGRCQVTKKKNNILAARSKQQEQ